MESYRCLNDDTSHTPSHTPSQPHPIATGLPSAMVMPVPLGIFAKLAWYLPHTVLIKNDAGTTIARVSSVTGLGREVTLKTYLFVQLARFYGSTSVSPPRLPPRLPPRIVSFMRASLTLFCPGVVLFRDTICFVYLASLQDGRWCCFDMQLAAALMEGDSILMYDAGREVYNALPQIDGLHFAENVDDKVLQTFAAKVKFAHDLLKSGGQ